MTKDPVCGMEIEETSAFSSQTIDGKVYYFCSKACEEKFLSDPGEYVDDPVVIPRYPDSTGSKGAKCSFGNDRRRVSTGHRATRNTCLWDNVLRVLPKHCKSTPGSKRSSPCNGKYNNRARPHLL